MIIRPRDAQLQTAPTLSALTADKSIDAMRDILDFEISFGRITSPDAWRINLSTLPWREGEDIRNLWAVILSGGEHVR